MGERTPWPNDTIADVVGWFAIVDDISPPWEYRIKSDHPIVILDSAWHVPTGTYLNLVTPNGITSVQAQRPIKVYLDCSNSPPMTLTSLSGEASPGMAWVVSPTFNNAQQLTITTQDTPESRSWTFGGHTIAASQVNSTVNSLWHVGSSDASNNTISNHRQPISLDVPMPQAAGAWRIGSKTVLGLFDQTNERVRFRAVVIGENPSQIDGIQVVTLGQIPNCSD